jgi:hypothetical protein
MACPMRTRVDPRFVIGDTSATDQANILRTSMVFECASALKTFIPTSPPRGNDGLPTGKETDGIVSKRS